MPRSIRALPIARQQRVGRVGMDQQRLGRVAHAHPLALGVDHQPLGHLGVGRAVEVDVAIAGVVLDDRHAGLFAHAADQALAAAGDGHVDVLRHAEQFAHGGAVGRGDQLHGVGRQPGLGGRLGQDLDDRRGSSGPPPCRRGGSPRCRS